MVNHIGSKLICLISSQFLFVYAVSAYTNYFNHSLIDVEKWDGKLCERDCLVDAEPRICYYHFTVENYNTMGQPCGDCHLGVIEDCKIFGCIPADGIERGVISINRQIPAPCIQVCFGDTIVVDLSNKMEGKCTTIHWHGIHQKETPYMDGVPMVTQCPIQSSTTFRYSYKATEAGTHFYHAHIGHQKLDGMFGCLTIRGPYEHDPNRREFDCDKFSHYLLITDWFHTYADTYVPGLRNIPLAADNLLLNGLGPYTDPANNVTEPTPRLIYYIKKGSRCRFRVIDSASQNCPMMIQFEGHRLKILAKDSFSCKPIIIDSLIMGAGERYDVVPIIKGAITKREYKIMVQALGGCLSRNIQQVAVLRYISENENENEQSLVPETPIPHYVPPYPIGITLNEGTTKCGTGESTNFCVSELEENPGDNCKCSNISRIYPDYKFMLTVGLNVVPASTVYGPDEHHQFLSIGDVLALVGQIKDISFEFPSIPVLSQSEEIIGIGESKTFCNQFDKPRNCDNQTVCFCTHRLKVDLCSVVELLLVDNAAAAGTVNHPFHLHGNKFAVLQMGSRDLLESMTEPDGTIRDMPYPPLCPPFADTISIPSAGFARIRFLACNPGFWLMHCHFDFHLSTGMALVFQVGEYKDFVPVPDHFPQCRNFKPDLDFI